MQMPKPSRLLVVTLGELFMVLPATVFLAAAAMRLLQPRQYEPAHTSWAIFEWTVTHVSRTGAAILFLGLPGLVAMVGCAILFGAWRWEQSLRQDATLALAILRRNLVLALLVLVTLLGGAVLTFALTHVVVG